MASLNFQFEEPFDEPLLDDYFNILNSFVQPDSQASTQDAAKEIFKIHPKVEPTNEDGSDLIWVAAEMSSQIPYTHPSMKRLANLIALVLNSQEHVRDAPDSPTIGRPDAPRYNGFKQEVREIRPEGDSVQNHVNYTAFLAHVYSEIWKEHPLPLQAIWNLQQALEDPHDDGEKRVRYTMSAALWILIYGDAMFKIMNTDEPDEGAEGYPPPLYHKRASKNGLSKMVASVTSAMKHEKRTRRDRWNFWRGQFEKLASDKEVEGKEPAHAQEMKKLCHDAAQRMREVEKGI